MKGDLEPELTAYPDLRDPRVIVAVPRGSRAALAALWALAERLTKLLREAREPLIGQIKLAWWRDMMALIANDPAALPKGEPLLAELHAAWAGQGGLEALVDAAEAMLLAEDEAGRQQAAVDFGEALFDLSAVREGHAGRGRRWGLLWGAQLQDDAASAHALLAAAKASEAPRSLFSGERALLMLDRWAGAIALADGGRDGRREGLLLLRLGLIGR